MERGAVPAGGAEQARSVLQPESPAAVPALPVALCSRRGADIDVAAEHELSKSFVFPGANEIVELAAGRARRAAQIIEPGLWPLDKATNDDETDPPRVTTLS